MKAKERHKLKSNDLVDNLREIGEYLQKHGNRILTVVAVALILAGAGLWYYKSKAKDRSMHIMQLQNLMVQADVLQATAAGNARDPQQFNLNSAYNIDSVVGSLGELAQEEAGTPISRTALLQQAEDLRSELLFSNRAVSEQERSQLCEKADHIYQRILTEHPQDIVSVASAKMGLACIAEELGQWDKARQIYQEISADGKEGRLAGTVFPLQAGKRLALLDKISNPIVFPPAPEIKAPELPVEPAKEAPAKTAPAKEEPAKAAPAKEEPAKAAPAKEEPVKAEPAKEEPVKAEPAKEEPVKAEPEKEEPVKAEPEKTN